MHPASRRKRKNIEQRRRKSEHSCQACACMYQGTSRNYIVSGIFWLSFAKANTNTALTSCTYSLQPWGERSAHCMILCQVDRLWQTLQLSIRTASKRWSQKQSQQSPSSNKWLNRWLPHAEWLRCLCGGAPCLYVSRWRKTGSISELWDQMARRRPSQERHFGLHVELIRIWSTDHQKYYRGRHHLQPNRSKNSLQTLSLRRKASLSSPLWEWASSNHTSCGFLHNLSYCEYTMETLGLNWVRISYSHDLRV